MSAEPNDGAARAEVNVFTFCRVAREFEEIKLFELCRVREKSTKLRWLGDDTLEVEESMNTL